MTIDPLTEAGLEGTEGLHAQDGNDGFVDNETYSNIASWLVRGEGSGDAARASLCDALERFGRVIGYSRLVGHDEEDDEGEGELGAEEVLAMVHLFQTEAGAEAFMNWVPDAAWGGRGESGSSVKRLPVAGSDAVLLSSWQGGGRVQVALVRRGSFVGEVAVSGPKSFTARVDTAALGMTLKERIESETPTGSPFDVVQVMSAPLSEGDWAAIQRRGQGYPGVVGWEQGADDSSEAPCCALHDIRSLADESEGQWDSDVAEFGILGAYSKILNNSQWMTDDDAQEFPVTGTLLTLLRDESGAAAALQDVVDDGRKAPGGLLFDVPGIEGAVGMRHWTSNSLPPDFEGYTWNVYFTHGAALARVFVAGGPPDWETYVEDEAEWDRNRQWVIDAAQVWAERLERVLGRGLTHAKVAPTGSAQPAPRDSSDPGGGSATSSFAHRPAVIDVGGGSACALDAVGKAYCWGDIVVVPPDGEGRTDGWNLNPPTAVPEAHEFREISAGGSHICGLDTAGRAWCWGYDWAGQLGDGGSSLQGSNTPASVAGGRSYVSISAGEAHTCAVDSAGKTWCWGRLGPSVDEGGSEQGETEPVAIAGDHEFAVIAAGSSHTCALDAAGKAWCWGTDGSGQLGDGPGGGGFAPVPVAVAGQHSFALITAGEQHTCAVDTVGRAWCWGSSSSGALGHGPADAGPDELSPVPVTGGLTFTAIDAGRWHTCAVDTAGSAWCWGSNSGFGQLGDGASDLQSKYAPVPVAGEHTFTTIAAGGNSSCAVDSAGNAWCWGDDQGGQLGQGKAGTPPCEPDTSDSPCSSTPLAVTGNVTFQTP